MTGNAFISNRWFWGFVCSIFLILGFCFDYQSGRHELVFETRTISPLKAGGQNREISMVTTPWSAAFQRILSNVCYVVGISFFVSAVIVKGFEDVRQAEQSSVIEKLREKVQEDVLQATLSTFVPKGIVAAVKRDILERAFVVQRGRWELDFTLGDDELLLETTGSYTVSNTKETVITEKRDIRTRPLESGGFRSLSVKIQGTPLTTFRPGDAIPDGIVIDERSESEILVLWHTVVIPPRSTAEIITTFGDQYLLTRGGEINDTIFAHYPTEELEINVRFPENCTFQLTPFVTSPVETVRSVPGRSDYRVGGAVLPGQGFAYTVRRPIEKK